MSKGLKRRSISPTLQVATDYQKTKGFVRNLPRAAFDRGLADPLPRDWHVNQPSQTTIHTNTKSRPPKTQ